MSDPASAAMLVMAIVGTGATVVGQRSAARAAAASSMRNADIARRAAADALKRGDVEIEKIRRDTGRIIGRQRAFVASAGAAVDEGSALEVLEDTAMLGELDVLIAKNNAAREAYGLETQSLSFLDEAASIKAASPWQTGGSLLTGASNALYGYSAMGGTFGGKPSTP